MGADGQQVTRLAECLCARLCHEMSGGLGTVAGTLDMALHDPAPGEALALAHEAAAEMVDRLRLLRAAWAGDCGAMDAGLLGSLLAGIPAHVRVELDGLGGTFDGPVARVLLNMLLLGIEALPRGGTIRLAGVAGGDVALTVTGNKAAWPAGLALALADPLAAPLDDPRTVVGPLTAQLAQAAGLRLALLFPAGDGGGAAPPLLLTV